MLGLGLPLVGSHVAQFAITLTDGIMLGRYSVDALAAEVLGGTLFFVIFIVGSGFAWAVMPMVASAEAKGERTEVRRVTRMGAWASILFALIMLPVMVFSEGLFLAAGQEAQTSKDAALYLSIVGFGLLPGLLVMVLKSYLAALERTQVVLWITVAAVGLMTMIDEGQPDHKIISVLTNDPEYADFEKASDFPKHTFKMLRRFFEDYKMLESKDVEVDEILPAEVAHAILEDSLNRYAHARRTGAIKGLFQ